MDDLALLGEMRFVIEVTRKDGAIEHYDMAGGLIPEDDAEPVTPKKDQ